MKYRKLKKYKFQIREKDLIIEIAHRFPLVKTDFVETKQDKIIIKNLYCWDGATCAITNKKFLVPSAAHDALCQLIRLQIVPPFYKNEADLVLKALCLRYKMWKVRANYVYFMVKNFGNKFMHIGQPQDVIYEVKEIN
jgi:hypothetical protein